MSYRVEYINCKICGKDSPRVLGIRGNLEYSGAQELQEGQEHIVSNIVRCRNCGFVYINPMLLNNNGLKGYENASEYQSSGEGIAPELIFKNTVNLIEKYSQKGKIIDIGCGKGEFLSVAEKRGWQAYGVEPSHDLADYALKKYNLKNIVVNKIDTIDFPDSFFDAATLNMALEHIDNPRLIIQEINRVLKNNGVLLIEVPNMDSLMLKAAAIYFRLKKRDWSPLLSPLHYPFHNYGYNISSLRYLLSTCNFAIKKVIVRDLSLRGIRSKLGDNNIEILLRGLMIKAGGWLGNGDILTVIALKK